MKSWNIHWNTFVGYHRSAKLPPPVVIISIMRTIPEPTRLHGKLVATIAAAALVVVVGWVGLPGADALVEPADVGVMVDVLPLPAGAAVVVPFIDDGIIVMEESILGVMVIPAGVGPTVPLGDLLAICSDGQQILVK